MKKVRTVAIVIAVLLLIGGIKIRTVEPDVRLKEQEQKLGVQAIVYRSKTGEARIAIYADKKAKRFNLVDLNEPVEMTIAEKAVREARRFVFKCFYSEPVTPSWTAEMAAPRYIPRTSSGSAISSKRPIS